MKKIKVIARARIIDPKTKKYHDDVGLCALNGYYENVFMVQDDFDEIMFILALEEEFPELKNRSFYIEEIHTDMSEE